MTTQLLEWYNLIFELPVVLGLMYLALYCISGWTFGDADTDTGSFEHGVDAHLDMHGEVSLDQDTDLSHDVHVDADSDHDGGTGANESPGLSFLSALNWIGIGRMPLSLVLMISMLCWGTVGFFAMRIQQGLPIERSVIVAAAAAATLSVCVTHFVSSILAKALFNNTDISRRRHELLGSFGEALYPIDDKFGMVCGRDDHGGLFQVACVVEAGQVPIEKGAAVQLVSYTAADRLFHVVPAATKITPRRVVGTAK
jgi:hypothetical protein